MRKLSALRLTRLLAPGSLRYQLLSRSLFILAALLLLIGLFQYVIMRQFLYQNKAEIMKSQLLSLPVEFMAGGNQGAGPREGTAPREGGGAGTVRDGGLRGGFFMPDATLAFYNSALDEFSVITENTEAGTAPQFAKDVYDAALQRRDIRNRATDYKVTVDAQGIEQLVVLAPLSARGRPAGVAELVTPVKPLKQVLLRQLFTFLALALLAMVVGLLAFLPILKRTLVPLSKIVDTVGRIDAGNLDERLPAAQGQQEIDRLSVSLGGMLKRLHSSFEAEREAKEQMRRFIADASHELRTPLTSIRGFLEVLLRGAANQPDQLHRALTSMHGESERLSKLVGDLLQLAKLDRSPSVHPEAGSLDAVVRDMEPQLRLLAGERTVRLTLAPDAEALFDRDRIKQVVLNLFHNAVQHTNPTDGVIDVTVEHKPGGVQLTVRDNGPGIPEEHLPHLFERFYRVDTSRARKHGGSGLGLSITKSIVDIHGGTIEVESRPGEGSTFRVTLPAG